MQFTLIIFYPLKWSFVPVMVVKKKAIHQTTSSAKTEAIHTNENYTFSKQAYQHIASELDYFKVWD